MAVAKPEKNYLLIDYDARETEGPMTIEELRTRIHDRLENDEDEEYIDEFIDIVDLRSGKIFKARIERHISLILK